MNHNLLSALVASAAFLFGAALPAQASPVEILNVSYDPTRELYTSISPNSGKPKPATR